MPVHKTCRAYLPAFVARLEGDGEVVDDVKFDGADVWVITYLPTRTEVVQNITYAPSGYETRGAS